MNPRKPTKHKKLHGTERADRAELEQISDAYDEYCTLKEKLRTESPTFTVIDQLGNKITCPNPAIKLMQATRQQIVTLIREFGGTPSNRSGISLGDKSEDDDFDEFFASTKH